MTTAIEQRTTSQVVPSGFLFLAVTAASASINWPVMKYLLSERPPMATRGLCGTAGAVLLTLIAAFAYALGTILLKKWPLGLPPISSAAWQLGLGCVPVLIAGLVHDHPDPGALSALGWTFIVYNIVIQQCAGYVCWLAALH